MWEISFKAQSLLICVFHFLGRETKDKFLKYKSDGSLDSALHSMIKKKLFPEWFCEEFSS